MTEKKSGFRRISDAAVREKTGKNWPEWFAELDKFCTPPKGHALIASHLERYHGLSPWWAQAVTIRWEWERGLRK
ncbi:MAG: hypothetical protein HYX83_03395 [Chloroflexi bacterium]|nr:hypothetical protein [Chloroflexota bacterium]